jgi:hypothetical protein
MHGLLPREVLFQAANSVNQWLKSMLIRKSWKDRGFQRKMLARDLISKQMLGVTFRKGVYGILTRFV